MMKVLVTCKATKDAKGRPGDALETGYIDFFKNHSVTAPNTIFLPVANHLENAKTMVKQITPDWILITGGNNLDTQKMGMDIHLDDTAPDRDSVEAYLFEYALKNNIPVMGICRGFQQINVLLGGSLSTYLQDHPEQPHLVHYHDETFTVNSFHSHGVYLNDLSDALCPLVLANDHNLVEAYESKNHGPYILGFQWHPEREDTDPEIFEKLYLRFIQMLPK